MPQKKVTHQLTKRSTYSYFIGIDTGTHTGVAVWNSGLRKFEIVKTMKIHEALYFIRTRYAEITAKGGNLLCRVEDARQRTWFGNFCSLQQDRNRLQGAGSVKRDCTIFEDALTDWHIPFEMVAPKRNATKLNASSFVAITGWEGRTSEHSRDAAMLVYGL